MPTQRYKLTIAYRGSHYHGWQTQKLSDAYIGKTPPKGHGVPTIQETLTRALAGVINHPVLIVGSSRTDSGVHAKGQVAHFDTHRVLVPKESLRRAVNHQLPPDIFIRAIEPVPDTFNAVASTERKRYQYAIWNSHDRDVFHHDMAWHRWQRLDLGAVRAAAAHFIGTHDFVSFAKPGHGRDSAVRTVHAFDVSDRGPMVVLGVEGSGFLWHMVRIMVGTLVQVGVGRYPPDRIVQMLAARDREAAGPTAPPHGLYLQWIRFRDPDEVSPTPLQEEIEEAVE